MTEEQARRNLRFATYLENQVKDEQFYMWEWCGTAACVGGHAALWPEYQSLGMQVDQCNGLPELDGFLGDAALKIAMGISDQEAHNLCYAADVRGEDISRQNRVDFIRSLVAKYHPNLVESA